MAISEKIPCAYTDPDGMRFYVFMPEVYISKEDPAARSLGFYIFDQDGGLWMQMLSVDREVIENFYNGQFFHQPYLTTSEPLNPVRLPVADAEVTKGNFELGFALDVVRDKLGLDIFNVLQAYDAAGKVSGDETTD